MLDGAQLYWDRQDIIGHIDRMRMLARIMQGPRKMDEKPRASCKTLGAERFKNDLYILALFLDM